MDIGKIDCGAELVLQPLDEKVGEVRLKIKPFPPNFDLPKEANVETLTALIAEFIIGWNVEDGGVAIPCTDGNKAKYLGYIGRLRVKDHEIPDGVAFAATEIAWFGADIANYLKN